jgi:cyclopropane fatty-acyl-phospholipid synthase-like methyltransferase
MTRNPYDELPYLSLPIEWTAPERLALASLLHGGPRVPRRGYRVLELGCADGANLLPQAYYRQHSTFVGVDGAASQIAAACAGATDLQLTNLAFVHADFSDADELLEGEFDYIICHGVFSWVSVEARDALLRLCARRLRQDGLLYLNYNAYPGWKVRGLVRKLLMSQPNGAGDLHARAALAQQQAAVVAAALDSLEHAYARLLANELRFVCEHHVSYVAHEFLSEENHAYWRSEFLALVRAHGFDYVADADFNYATGRLPEGLEPALRDAGIIVGRDLADTVDLFAYRQLHSPILTRQPLAVRLPDVEELATLTVASCLVPCVVHGMANAMFQHPSGYQVEAKTAVVRAALLALQPLWPRGLPICEVFPDVPHVIDDLLLLYRNGLIELRVSGDAEGQNESAAEPLERFERARGYSTTARHTREALVV